VLAGTFRHCELGTDLTDPQAGFQYPELLPCQSLALSAKAIDLVAHLIEECLGRGGGYSGVSKQQDLPALPVNPVPHAIDFAFDELDTRHLSTLE
jgi:hypothetical protein